MRSTCVPSAAHCDRGGSTRAVPPARREPPPPQLAMAEGAYPLVTGYVFLRHGMREARASRPMCVPPVAHRDRGGTGTPCAYRATRPPSPAGAGGGLAPCGPCVCRRLRIAIKASQARAMPPARRDNPPPSRRWCRAAHVCSVGAVSRTRWAGHALCRPHDATALPSRRCQRMRAEHRS